MKLRDFTAGQTFAPAMFPNLRGLRLTDDDLRALSEQGFIAEERRGKRKYPKLRFRRGGRQHVRYVPPGILEVVRHELELIQGQRRLGRGVIGLDRRRKQLLREMKRELEPLVRAEGLAFHGFSIRRPR
jgi:hypothetical protein